MIRRDGLAGEGLLSDRASRGPKAAFVEFLFAVAIEDFAADFLGEIFPSKNVRAGVPRWVT